MAWVLLITSLIRSLITDNFSRGFLKRLETPRHVPDDVVSDSNMATLESLGSSMESFIKEKVEIERFTYSELSQQLQTAYPGEKGFSARSLQRYCRAKGISKTSKIDDNMLDDVVAEAVSMVWND